MPSGRGYDAAIGVPVLEVLGPPGSGKSALAERLLHGEGWVVVKDHRAADLPALLRGVFDSRRVLTDPLPPGMRRTRRAAWVGRVAAVDQVVRRRVAAGAKGVVLDQGPAYTLERLMPISRGHDGAQWWHERVRRCSGLLDVLVVLTADMTVLLDRINARPKSHQVRGMPTPMAEDFLSAAHDSCLATASWLEFAGVPVLRVDTGRVDLDATVASVLARVEASGVRFGNQPR
ncbi:MAG TPA: AAA family ATPase [Nocardioidaceae bacterium]|nr:AAA family ATPase [Nocardioidaceae bacterium]